MMVICRTHYSRPHIQADPALRKPFVHSLQPSKRIRRPAITTFATMTSDKEAITEVLMKYEAALNESSTEKVMELYTPDGVFMPQHNPSAVGAEDVRKAYAGVFQALTLAVKFKVCGTLLAQRSDAFELLFCRPIRR